MSDRNKMEKLVTIINFISRKDPHQAESFLYPDSETKSSNHSMKMTLLASNFQKAINSAVTETLFPLKKLKPEQQN